MHIIFVDPTERKNYYPLALTRSIADFRCGIVTLKEKWTKRLPNATFSIHGAGHLAEKYHLHLEEQNIIIDANIIATDRIVDELFDLELGSAIFIGEAKITMLSKEETIDYIAHRDLEKTSITSVELIQGKTIDNCRDIFLMNEFNINEDFELITQGRKTAPLSSSNNTIGNNVFVEEGAKIECATLNSSTGPIYIGKDVEIMEGSVIRGPFAACEHSGVKLGAKIYGPTTLGPHAKIGGEANNVVIFGYSNKGHDGFLGNSVLGEWCNLGADTNNSNLKNNYSLIKTWDYTEEDYTATGLQFCGLIMGDHSKSGINTMFNTGTTVGVAANVFGSNFPPKFVPSFNWGDNDTFQLDKVFEMAENMMKRRKVAFTESDKNILKYIFEYASKFRS